MEDRSFIDSLKGMRIGGRYVVDRVLGAGGMGVVALARYPELEQKVAIKFLLPMHAANSILNARFVREARLAAKVRSEHFVRVFDIGKLHTGVPYLVMELLSGRDLGDELAARGPLPVEQALDYVLQAAVGVAEIHALGVVHRDLKPSNLFVAEAAGKQTIKVLDFGISKENAKDGGAALTSTDNLLGTPQYMSPEQVRASKDVDARSDIWALGVILYEVLTGERPFVSEENAVGELFAKVLYADPIPPRQHRPELPEGLEAIVLRCLARDREERYATVGELAEALRPFAAPASALRIDTVKQALLARRSMSPPAEREEEGEITPASRRVTTPDAGGAGEDPALAATSASDAALGSSLGVASDKPAAKEPVTVMTSSSSRREGKQSGRSLALVGGAAIVLAGIGAFAFTSRAKPLPSAEPSASGMPANVASAASSPASEPAAPAVDAGATTLLPLLPDPPPSAAAAPGAAVTTAAPSRPAVPPASTVARPKPTAQVTASKTPAPNDLILDRK